MTALLLVGGMAVRMYSGPRTTRLDVSRAAAAVRRQLATDVLPMNGTVDLDTGVAITLKEQLGEGRFGRILLGESSADGPVAIKIALRPSGQLAKEAAVLHAMRGVPGFPELHHYQMAADSTGSELLVMELLGPSLESLWHTATAGTHFSTPTVFRVGRDTLRHLRQLHHMGFVHNDVKPGNIVLGATGSTRETELHLIDFGLSTRVLAAGTACEHGDAMAERVGTPMYASIAAHNGRPTGPVDDVESLVYCLAFLAAGNLPWQHKRHSRAAFMKRRMLTDGCELLTDSCAAEMLTEEVHSSETAHALQMLWAEVVACHATGQSIDYDACLAALVGDDESASALVERRGETLDGTKSSG